MGGVWTMAYTVEEIYKMGLGLTTAESVGLIKRCLEAHRQAKRLARLEPQAFGWVVPQTKKRFDAAVRCARCLELEDDRDYGYPLYWVPR